MKKILSIVSMLTLCLSLAFPGETILADTSGSSEHVVIAEEVSNPDYYAGGVIQECLNEAKDYATAGKPYRIVVPAGKYTLHEPLRIYSNTILDLKGVTFTKSYDKNNKVNLICTGTMAPIAYEGEKGYETRNISILNNTFNNISSSAIKGMYWKNVEISGNTITNTPKGIQFSVFRDGGVGTFLPSDLSKEGKVPTSVSDKYKEENNYNIKIVNNKITLCFQRNTKKTWFFLAVL